MLDCLKGIGEGLPKAAALGVSVLPLSVQTQDAWHAGVRQRAGGLKKPARAQMNLSGCDIAIGVFVHLGWLESRARRLQR